MNPHNKSQNIADHLRDQIHKGTLKPGDKLPSHRALADHYDVANMTIRAALDILRNENLIRTAQGFGSYITNDADENPHPQPPPPPDGHISRILLNNMRLQRIAHGWTQEQLAAHLTTNGHPVTRNRIANMEVSTYKTATVELLVALTKTFDTTTDTLLQPAPCHQCNTTPPPGYTCNTCGRMGPPHT